MKRVLVSCGMAMVLLASVPAAAQNDSGDRRVGQGSPAREARPQRIPARDAAAENRNANRSMHMTPEQRRQLRRDIHDHGRDIYRDRGSTRRRR